MNRKLKHSGITLVLALAMVAAFALPATAGETVAEIVCPDTEAQVGAMEPATAADEEPRGPDGDKKTYQKNETGAGLYLVGTGPARTFTWRFQGTCMLVVDDNVPPSLLEMGELTANGLGTGWAGHSIGSTGKGEYVPEVGSTKTETIHLNQIWWESAGTLLFVRFKHDAFGKKDSDLNHRTRGLGNGQAVVNARPPGDLSPQCEGVPGSAFPDNKKDDDGKNGATCFTVEIEAVLHASPNDEDLPDEEDLPELPPEE